MQSRKSSQIFKHCCVCVGAVPLLKLSSNRLNRESANVKVLFFIGSDKFKRIKNNVLACENIRFTQDSLYQSSESWRRSRHERRSSSPPTQAFLEDETRAPLKTPAWEATKLPFLAPPPQLQHIKRSCLLVTKIKYYYYAG